jgi:Xaa-Pro dipeptidase
MIPIFPEEEFAARHERARRRMDEAGLRALVATSPGNQFWLSGYRGAGVTQGLASYVGPMVTPRIVLPLAGEPVLLGLATAAAAYERETHFSEFRTMVNPLGDTPRTVRAVLEDRGVRSGRVGADLSAPGGLSPGDADRLCAALDPLEIVDATSLLTELRMVKTPREIAALRRAVEIQNEAFRLFLPRLSRRMSDADLRWELHKAQMEAGASDSALVLLGGHSAAALFGVPSDEPTRERGLRWIDGGASHLGYVSDYDVIVAWGEPSAEAIAVHASLVENHVEAMTAWRPGRTLAEIGEETHSLLERRGVRDPLGGAFMGHCLGFDVVERPWFGRRASRRLVLESGMVISPEWLNETSVGTLLWEENFLVTESGLERLSDAPEGLHVVAD